MQSRVNDRIQFDHMELVEQAGSNIASIAAGGKVVGGLAAVLAAACARPLVLHCYAGYCWTEH